MKDAYYFPHFCTARSDRKVKRLRKELGIEGYGIFFMLLEVLREQTDLKYPIRDLDLLADEFETSEQKIRTVVRNYDLFEIDEGEKFFSPRLLVFLEPYFKKSERARKAANIRWEKKKELSEQNNNDANAMQMHSKCNADAMQVKESKVKEIKEKEIKKEKERFNPPTLNDIKNYIKEKQYKHVDSEKFFYFYESKDWFVGKNKMKDWKKALSGWEARNRPKEETEEDPYKDIIWEE